MSWQSFASKLKVKHRQIRQKHCKLEKLLETTLLTLSSSASLKPNLMKLHCLSSTIPQLPPSGKRRLKYVLRSPCKSSQACGLPMTVSSPRTTPASTASYRLRSATMITRRCDHLYSKARSSQWLSLHCQPVNSLLKASKSELSRK